MSTKLRAVELGAARRDSLFILIGEEADKRIFELEREPASIHMNPEDWGDILVDDTSILDQDHRAVSYNHFRGILVLRDPRMERGYVAIQWKKPA